MQNLCLLINKPKMGGSVGTEGQPSVERAPLFDVRVLEIAESLSRGDEF
jgi:hypothetical protein